MKVVAINVINPLKSTPLNTKHVYVMATAPSGCEVYMPVDSDEDNIIHKKKEELQNYLNITNSTAPLLS